MSKCKRMVKKVLEELGAYQKIYDSVLKYREKKYVSLTEEQKVVELKKWYKKCTGQALDLDNPSSFNEKIQWLKLYDNQEIKTILSDKYLVRKWVAEKIGEQYLIPIYGACESVEEIDFSMLPSQFVLKANHGSAMNLVVKEKGRLDIKGVKKTLNAWLKTPYDLSGMEQQYYKIGRRIVVEKYIEQSNGELLDYKIHCFNGIPRIIQIIGERNLAEHTAKEAFFDVNWNQVHHMYSTYAQYDEKELPERPECLEAMLKIAEKLSESFCYVRVDLYVLEEGIKFGELTFTPASGIGKWSHSNMDEMVGQWINLETVMKSRGSR